jgi:hypothetical protein
VSVPQCMEHAARIGLSVFITNSRAPSLAAHIASTALMIHLHDANDHMNCAVRTCVQHSSKLT